MTPEIIDIELKEAHNTYICARWMTEICKAKKVSKTAKDIYALVCSFTYNGKNKFYASHTYIANMCYCTRRSVVSAINELCESKLVIKSMINFNGTNRTILEIDNNTLLEFYGKDFKSITTISEFYKENLYSKNEEIPEDLASEIISQAYINGDNTDCEKISQPLCKNFTENKKNNINNTVLSLKDKSFMYNTVESSKNELIDKQNLNDNCCINIDEIVKSESSITAVVLKNEEIKEKNNSVHACECARGCDGTESDDAEQQCVEKNLSDSEVNKTKKLTTGHPVQIVSTKSGFLNSNDVRVKPKVKKTNRYVELMNYVKQCNYPESCMDLMSKYVKLMLERRGMTLEQWKLMIDAFNTELKTIIDKNKREEALLDSLKNAYIGTYSSLRLDKYKYKFDINPRANSKIAEQHCGIKIAYDEKGQPMFANKEKLKKSFVKDSNGNYIKF